jgi:tRNA/tmRNA/rRNA uracil-C5-methylase (TrmA/RlmC/RlmD family)
LSEYGADDQSACPKDCPGCGRQKLLPENRLRQKEAWLTTRLNQWKARMDPIQTVPENQRWHYRNKVCLSTRWDQDAWRFGLIRKETLIPIHDCPIHTVPIGQAIALFSEALPPALCFPLSYYAHSGGQVTLVVKSAKMPDVTWLDEQCKKRLTEIGIEGLWVHLHPSCGKKVFTKNTWHLLHGAPQSTDDNGLVYGPRSFQQLIPRLYDQSMEIAEAFLAPNPGACMVDLYCGIGAGLARWRQKCDHVMGVELDGEAVTNARINAPGAAVLRGACRTRIPQLVEFSDAQQPGGGRRLLYVNPPRTGLEPETLNWVTTHYKPLRMAYLSCSAGTLHRDLTLLEAAGYRVDRIFPFDFFPNTPHVETLVLLSSPQEKAIRISVRNQPLISVPSVFSVVKIQPEQ